MSRLEAIVSHPQFLDPCNQCEKKSGCNPNSNIIVLHVMGNPEGKKKLACNNLRSKNFQEIIVFENKK